VIGAFAGRSRRIDSVVAFFLCEALAVAVWLVPASAHIVQWPASGPVRLALLAPLWQLRIAIVLGAVAWVGVVWSAVSVRAFAPMLALSLWAIPYVPWLPDQLPLLLVFAGPLRWMVLAAALSASLARLPSARRALSRIWLPTRSWVFAISLALYAIFGVWATETQGLGGDEPHYLIISDSLLKDRDLQIENNHQQKDYASYFFGELRPDFIQRGKNGQIYSIHAPGLPVLSLPAYAVFGYRGVILFVALLAALAALTMFDLADRLAGRSAAVVTWIATCASAPFIPYAWSIFPEMPGAWVVAYCVVWLWEGERRSSRVWIVRSAALGLLPWVHTRFVILSLVFGLAFALRLRRSPRPLLAFVIPATIMAVAWLYSFYAIYGIWSPEAPYGTYASEFVRFGYIFHGLVGILFDQKFGLLFYSPIYLAAPIGFWLLLRDPQSRTKAAVLLVAVAAYVGSTARLYMFWGGSSAPARLLVPIVPCLAPMVAVAVARLRHPLWRGLIGFWCVLGVGVGVFSMVAPDRLVLFSEPHGRARILEMLQAGSPLALSVPTFTDPDWALFLTPLAWWLSIAAIAIAGAVLVARFVPASAWALTALASGLFVGGGAALTSRPEAPIRRATAQRGALELLEHFDGPNIRVANFRTLRLASPDESHTLTTVTDIPEAPVPEDGRVLGPLTFPPGRYHALVWFKGKGQRRGEVTVAALGQTVFATYDGVLANPLTVPFEIPITIGRLIVRLADAEVAAAVSRVDIVPDAVVPASERDPSPVYAVESVPPRDGALIAYTDEGTYPEHGTFWTRGTGNGRVLIAPAGAAKLLLFVSTGPNTSRVTWRVGGSAPVTTTVPGGEEISLVVDLPSGARLVPLEIRSSTMFRPGEVDPTSTDTRRLGCRIRIVLE
jgi:hypothetical protein